MIPELAEVYVNAIVMVGSANSLRVMHQTGMQKERAGRLWFTANGNTTIPDVVVQYAFGADTVGLRVAYKNDRPVRSALNDVVKYAEGLDGWLATFDQDLKAGLLAAPKKSAQEVL